MQSTNIMLQWNIRQINKKANSRQKQYKRTSAPPGCVCIGAALAPVSRWQLTLSVGEKISPLGGAAECRASGTAST